MRLLFALFALIQVAAAQAGRVEGRVITTAGAPVNKATVRLRAMAQPVPGQASPIYVETTNTDGRFSVATIAPGRYSVEAVKVGYSLARGAATTLDVSAGASNTGVEVQLMPLAVISGVVTDSDGEPIQGVRMSLLRYTFSSGRLNLSNIGSSASTDDRGAYRLVNVQPGRYYVQATPSNPIMANEIRGESARMGSLPTYYPNADVFRSALAVNVGATEVSGINIRLNQGRRHTIQGTFAGASGGVSITVFRRGENEPSGPGFSTSSNSTKSTFQVSGLTPGQYTIILRVTPRPAGAVNRESVQQAAQQQVQFNGRADVTVSNADVENVEIRLQPGAEVTGHITVEGGDTASVLASTPFPATPRGPDGIAVTQAVTMLRKPSVTLMAAEGPPAGVQGQVNEDGTFRIANIPPLKRLIQLSNLPPNVYLKSVRFGGQDITRMPLDLSSGAGGSLDLILSTKGASVTVTPRNDRGEAASGVVMAVWPRVPNPASPTGDLRTGNAIPVLQAQGLAPGEYYAAAWISSQTDYFRSPEFLARFNSSAKLVTLGEGESASVDVPVIPADVVEKELAQFP